jgi:hypothetical protein
MFVCVHEKAQGVRRKTKGKRPVAQGNQDDLVDCDYCEFLILSFELLLTTPTKLMQKRFHPDGMG